MADELVSQIALELIPGVGNKASKQLTSYCGSAQGVFSATKGKLLKIPGVGEKLANIILASNPINEAQEILASAQKIGSEILHYSNPAYPERLKEIADAPSIIYKKGTADLNHHRIISVVGTRKATDYGKALTEQIIKDLADLDVMVISGLAYGIDIAAHRESLKQNISTTAVLAGGLDRVYPSAHKKYAIEMLEKGAILTESIPGTKPDPHLFPARNRIIAGMADATIVIEAAEKGGALITAHLADSYDRLVFALPGNVNNTYSKGTNKLIASQRALIYTGVDDLLYHLNWDKDQQSQPPPKQVSLAGNEQVIYDLLKSHAAPIEIDLIAIHSNLPVSLVASILLTLEFKNLVASLPGKKYSCT